MLGSVAELSFRLANPSLSCLRGRPAHNRNCEELANVWEVRHQDHIEGNTAGLEILIQKSDTSETSPSFCWAAGKAGSLVPQPSECLFQGLAGKRSSLHRGWSHWNFANLTWQECQMLVERRICLDILRPARWKMVWSVQQLPTAMAHECCILLQELLECLCLMSRGAGESILCAISSPFCTSPCALAESVPAWNEQLRRSLHWTTRFVKA